MVTVFRFSHSQLLCWKRFYNSEAYEGLQKPFSVKRAEYFKRYQEDLLIWVADGQMNRRSLVIDTLQTALKNAQHSKISERAGAAGKLRDQRTTDCFHPRHWHEG